ncbi:uncharacterized protein LOC124912463 [Impatiens glandulifera]|uniref:uncharacterized protein LOC124912463 n=1 Tax=Impatiens glandulifera TaxID=253017 RepID=UPI001FB1880D|nr:uncharacterized protein LOC124912463 [Impatiens glandulifera]
MSVRRPPPLGRSVAPDTGSSTSIPVGNFRFEKGAAAMSSGRDSHRHDAAQWEGHPQRCTFFLEVLAEEKSEGRMPQDYLTNMLYRKLADRFFDKFQVWHDKGQFRNHYNSRRDQWRLVKELQILQTEEEVF